MDDEGPRYINPPGSLQSPSSTIPEKCGALSPRCTRPRTGKRWGRRRKQSKNMWGWTTLGFGTRYGTTACRRLRPRTCQRKPSSATDNTISWSRYGVHLGPGRTPPPPPSSATFPRLVPWKRAFDSSLLPTPPAEAKAPCGYTTIHLQLNLVWLWEVRLSLPSAG